MKKGDYYLALEHYEKALKAAQESENLLMEAQITTNIASFHQNLGNLEKAHEMALRSMELVEKLGMEHAKVYIYGVLSELELPEKQLLDYVDEAIQMTERIGMEPYLRTFKTRRAEILHQQGKTEEALDILLPLFDSRDRSTGIELSKLYRTLTSIYLERNQMTQAEQYLNELMKLADVKQSEQDRLAAEELQLQLYGKLGRYEDYYQLASRHYAYNDSVKGQERINKLAMLQAELDDVVQKEEIAILNQSLEREEARRNLIIGGSILGALFLLLIIYFRNRQIKIQKKQVALEKASAEELKKVNEKLTELDEMKTRLFTNISHELRTPLTVISGMVKKIDGNEEAREMIQRNSENLLDLTNQILELRSAETGKLKVNYQQSDIVSYLGYVMESLKSLAESKNVKFEFKHDIDELVMDFDREKILRIVTNLIANAVKFTDEGGKVILRIEQEGDQAKISVRDNGIGIPDDQLPRLFERFYQVDPGSYSSVQANTGGTGIGLTLSKELVTLLGGTIQVESEEEMGTEFNVSLPIRNDSERVDDGPASSMGMKFTEKENQIAESAATIIEDEATADGELPLLLIVEDSADVAKYLVSCVKDDYRIILAKDGLEGLEQAVTHMPDIIISDVMMPKKDGYELCREIKSDDRTSHIPIILLTAKADDESRLEGLEHGADAYLSKPFDERELKIRLQKLLEIRKVLHARYDNLSWIPSASDAKLKSHDEFVLKIKDIIHANISEEGFGASELCKSAGMSRTQLHNKLKSMTGLSTSHFIRQVKLEEASKLLKESEMNISEIAFHLGFSNLHYFSRIFTKKMGLSPSQYREIQ